MVARYSIDKAIRAAVLAVPGVAELVGARVYSDEAVPQFEPLPYVSIMLIGDVRRDKAHSGALRSCRARYQLDFYGATKEQAHDLAELVGARQSEGGLEGFKGRWGAGNDSTVIQACWMENNQHGSIDPASAEEARKFFAGFDLKITFNG